MIEVSHLTKRYGRRTAVTDLTFTLKKGRVCGFLGPNGAGKSTTMQILAGCLAPTEGQITVDGTDPAADPAAVKKKIGFLPEVPPLYPDLTVSEMLTFAARLKGIPKAEEKAAVEKVLEMLSITDVRNRLVRVLSKGYRQRTGFAAALLGDPDYIILDEPTEGLDPGQILRMRELIRALGKERGILLSTHILSEVQGVCDSVMIISNGKMAANLDPAGYAAVNREPGMLEKLFLSLTAKEPGEGGVS